MGRETGSGKAAPALHHELERLARRLLWQEFARSEHPFDDILHGVEKALIEKALEMTGGDPREASHLLGIPSKTLREKIDAYGILPG